MMFYMWLILIIILGIIEALTVNLVTIWFLASALVSMLLSFIIKDFIIQFAVFVILGIILMILTKKKLESKLITKEKTNLDRIIGMKGIVTEEIDEMVVGEVKVDGKRWSAVSNNKLQVGEYVKILKINGVKLEVERIKE